MSLAPRSVSVYHVFIASPGDVGAEREYVRRFFAEYNRHTAHIWQARFEVIGWDTDSTIGVGRPQELINQSTLEKYRDSLALVIGIMAQRFGTPSGKWESGTREEFDIAIASCKATGFPEIKWFFRKVDKLELPTDPGQAMAALVQWQQVLAFRKEMQDLNNPVFYTEYPGAAGFAEVFERDLNQWLADSARPWAAERAAEIAAAGGAAFAAALPADFDSERYRQAVLKQFDKLNFEMLDTTGAFYSSVRLWSVFVPQSARECHQYNPRLLEIPKEHQKRLSESGAITAEELGALEKQADQLRREYFSQPRRSVLEVIDEALRASASRAGHRLVILGDPGSGKSSLVRYLALRWASVADRIERGTQPIPLVIDLGSYGRWQCEGRKEFTRFLEEAPVWYNWPAGLLERLLEEPARVVLLLDGLDEIFELKSREEVVNDAQRFCNEHAQVPIVMTSRVVGYQSHALRDAEFRHFMLQDLDAGQIDAFVDRWHEETFDDREQGAPKRERLKKAIHDSRSIAVLAGNPLLLTMMAILNRNQELPRDRVDLYGQASRLLLHQWDTERALADFPGLSAEIGWREKTDMLRRVASFMQAGPGGLKGNMIDGPTLTSMIESYLHAELRFGQSRAAARAVVEHLRQRNFILCFVGADSYGFVHRTFLEYFCAADFVHQFNIAKTLNENGVIALFDEHCRQDEWREVLRLICGQIDEPFVGRIVEHLAARTDLKKWDDHSYLPELALATLLVPEARNSQRLETAGGVLLELILSVVGRAGWSEVTPEIQRLLDDLIDAIESVGPRWPGASRFLPLSVPNFRYRRGGGGQFVWARLVAALEGDMSGEGTRVLASEREYDGVRAGAIALLAEKWPDKTTRKLLAERAVQDRDQQPRSAALDSLAEKWPDETTRQLLTGRAVQDEDEVPRRVSLNALAEKWPDDATRKLLTERAVQDDHEAPRRASLNSLTEAWPDKTTRELLTERAVQDQHESPRGAALKSLVEKWPDEMTRKLLTERAAQDEDEVPRRVSLNSLAEQWPDETTRTLLTERAVEDQNEGLRINALNWLAEKWPDETTRTLLTERAIEDADTNVRGFAASLVVGAHSEFGRLIFARDLNGRFPYLDPHSGLPRAHIEKCAARVGLPAGQLESAIAALSRLLGWDVTVGARTQRPASPPGRVPRRKKR
jgi:NACHT domain